MTVGESEARGPSLVTVVAGCTAVERNADTADIIEGIAAVQSEEVTLKTLAQPVTELGHHHPVPDLAVRAGIERPRVVAAGNVERRPLAQAELKAQVERRGRPVERVGLDRHLLGIGIACTLARKYQEDG